MNQVLLALLFSLMVLGCRGKNKDSYAADGQLLIGSLIDDFGYDEAFEYILEISKNS